MFMKEKFTEYQRLNLINQYTILRDLAEIRKDNYYKEKYETFIEILSEGYVGMYSDITEELSDEFPAEESRLVWDILQIYSYIKSSYERLEKPTISKSQIHFDGFDGNEEIPYYGFCKFVLFTLKRFSDLTENGQLDINSHCNRVGKYRVMINKWNEMNRPYMLTEEQIKTLLSL